MWVNMNKFHKQQIIKKSSFLPSIPIHNILSIQLPRRHSRMALMCKYIYSSYSQNKINQNNEFMIHQIILKRYCLVHRMKKSTSLTYLIASWIVAKAAEYSDLSACLFIIWSNCEVFVVYSVISRILIFATIYVGKEISCNSCQTNKKGI